MTGTYTAEEDVTLLQAVLQSGAHLIVRQEGEIDAMNHYILKRVMGEVVRKFRAIKRKEGFKFPDRSPKALNHRYHKMLHQFAVAKLSFARTEAERLSRAEGLCLRRINLLKLILTDREEYNKKRRKPSPEMKVEPCEEESAQHLDEETQSERLTDYYRYTATKQNDANESNQPCSDGPSASQGNFPTKTTSKVGKTETKVEVKKEKEELCDTTADTTADRIGEQKSRCVQFLQAMIGQSVKKRSAREDRTLAMEEALLGTEKVANKSNPRSDEDFRYRELQLECMKTIVRKRKLELREKKLDMRHEKKMMRFMEKMLG